MQLEITIEQSVTLRRLLQDYAALMRNERDSKDCPDHMKPRLDHDLQAATEFRSLIIKAQNKV